MKIKILSIFTFVTVFSGTLSFVGIMSGCESPKKIRGFGEITLQNDSKIEVPNEKEFNKLCDTLGPDASLVINGTSFTKSTLKGFAFGNEFNLSSIRDYFLDECTSFNQPLTIPTCVHSIGDYFLESCTSFNQPLTISNVMELGNDFLYNCTSFNQSLIIPVSVTTIGTGFLYGCSNYNGTVYCPENTSKPSGWSTQNAFGGCISPTSWTDPAINWEPVRGFGEITLYTGLKIEVPNDVEFNKLCNSSDASLTINGTSFTKSTLKGFAFGSEFDLSSIRSYFLSGCTSFNQPLTIPTCVQSIGDFFLQSCISFNQPLIISNSVHSIGRFFLCNCGVFKHHLVIPNSVDTIGAEFLSGSVYNGTVYCPGNISKPSGWSVAGAFESCISPTSWTDPKIRWNESPSLQ